MPKEAHEPRFPAAAVDGHEDGSRLRMADNRTLLMDWLADDVDGGLQFEMGFAGGCQSHDLVRCQSEARQDASSAHFVAQSLAFVLDNVAHMRVACLEDFMRSEDDFYSTCGHVASLHAPA